MLFNALRFCVCVCWCVCIGLSKCFNQKRWCVPLLFESKWKEKKKTNWQKTQNSKMIKMTWVWYSTLIKMFNCKLCKCLINYNVNLSSSQCTHISLYLSRSVNTHFRQKMTCWAVYIQKFVQNKKKILTKLAISFFCLILLIRW